MATEVNNKNTNLDNLLSIIINFCFNKIFMLVTHLFVVYITSICNILYNKFELLTLFVSAKIQPSK